MIGTGLHALDGAPIEAVIFDLDGTLYPQAKLRRLMVVELALSLWKDPKAIEKMRALRAFRRFREHAAGLGGKARLEQHFARVAMQTGLKTESVRAVVSEWMFERPLKHLAKCRYDGVAALFVALRVHGIKRAVFSDYPVAAKLAAMGLTADAEVCSTDPRVQRLKPNPKGLALCCQQLAVCPARALFIGDRDELDGECARRAGMPYLILPQKRSEQRVFYHRLRRHLQVARSDRSGTAAPLKPDATKAAEPCGVRTYG